MDTSIIDIEEVSDMVSENFESVIEVNSTLYMTEMIKIELRLFKVISWFDYKLKQVLLKILL